MTELTREQVAVLLGGTTEPDNLVQQLRGRAAFCRDRGEVKTPELLEEAADRLSDADMAQAALLERAAEKLGDIEAAVTPEPFSGDWHYDKGTADGIRQALEIINALAPDAGMKDLAALRADVSSYQEQMKIWHDKLEASDADRDRLAAELAEARKQVEALRGGLSGWVHAVDEMVAFEAANPDNSTKAWSQRLDAIEAAEDAARAVLAAAEDGKPAA